MSKTDLKKQKDLFKDLDKLYDKNKPRIINWLKDTVVERTLVEYRGQHNNKITNLLNTSKIQIDTTSEYGVYNLILQWFLNNKDKFTDTEELKLFDNIPSTTFTKISKEIMMKYNSPRTATSQNLNIEEVIKKWKENPTTDPYSGSEVKISIVLKSKYAKLYEKIITHLTKALTPTDIMNPEIFETIRKQLPTNHIYASKEIDYIQNLKRLYNDDVEDKWIDFLVKQKDLIYSKETILEKKGYIVYDHLFMHFYLKKNKKHFKDYNIKEKYIDNQEFLYETIENQIKLVKAVDMDCQEVIDSMLNFTSEQNKGINFEVKRIKVTSTEWPYRLPPLLKLFTEYLYEISYYLIKIQTLNSTIFHDYFLYGNKKTGLDNKMKIEYIDNSIKYNKYRLKSILNLILGSMYNSDNSEKINIKTFLKILWAEIKDVIFEEQKYHNHKRFYYPISDEKVFHLNITKQIGEDEIKNIKMFFVSSIFDIDTVHKESQENNNVLYEPVIDPYNNLPEPPKIPKGPVISQELERYRKTSHIRGKNSTKEKELKEHSKKEKQFKKELKSYDKKLKEYNDKYLDKKLSPYFSVKLSRAKSVINDKNSLRLSYSPLKVSTKSLTKFKSHKNKELLSKFEKEPYSRTHKKKEIASQEIENSDEEIDEEIDEEMQRIKRFQEAKRERERERQRIERERQQIETERERLVQQGRPEAVRAERELQIDRERWMEVWQERERERQERYGARGGGRARSNRSSRTSNSNEYSSSGGALGQTYIQMLRGGDSKTKLLSKSDLKLKLALEANNHKFKKYAKSLSPSGKSPRQKYVGCDLNDNDPITQETFGDLHFKKIKYLSKIKTTLPDGKIITHCYDTIPFYNYILDCNNKGEEPLNLVIGKVPLTLGQKEEVFKKIKFFTKEPTLGANIDTTKNYFLKANYKPSPYRDGGHYTTYDIYMQINIGSIDFNIVHNNTAYFGGRQVVLHNGPIISRDGMLFEDTSDETVLLIQKGMENGSLLKVNSYPYWNSNGSGSGNIPYRYKFLSLPTFTFSSIDSIQQLEERTKAFNNTLRILI